MTTHVECPACGRSTFWLARQGRFRHHLWREGRGLCPAAYDEYQQGISREVFGLTPEWPYTPGRRETLTDWLDAIRARHPDTSNRR